MSSMRKKRGGERGLKEVMLGRDVGRAEGEGEVAAVVEGRDTEGGGPDFKWSFFDFVVERICYILAWRSAYRNAAFVRKGSDG